MACFMVPAVEAIIVTALEKHVEKKEAELDSSLNFTSGLGSSSLSISPSSGSSHQIMDGMRANEAGKQIPLSRKLSWLKYMLWGGVILLAFEHVWHGEVVPWFPFLTAMSDPVEAGAMFHEMATVGVCMAILITAVWFVIRKVCDVIASRPEPSTAHALSAAGA